MEIEENAPVQPPFKRNWGKIEWTGWCSSGTCYVGCTEEEYINMIADEEKYENTGAMAEME